MPNQVSQVETESERTEQVRFAVYRRDGQVLQEGTLSVEVGSPNFQLLKLIRHTPENSPHLHPSRGDFVALEKRGVWMLTEGVWVALSHRDFVSVVPRWTSMRHTFQGNHEPV